MKMHTESINILAEKRAALNAGDDALLKSVGEGKDIMSILCKPDLSMLIFSVRDLQVLIPVRANTEAAEEDRLPEEEVLGQMKCVHTLSQLSCRLQD